MLPGVDHLPHTHLPQNAFCKGQPEHGAELADALEGIVNLHDASNIAAVIVEPCAGSTGYLPPPKGYLERLRQICDKHGILLIFDEVITGFGRLGTGFRRRQVRRHPRPDDGGQGHLQRHGADGRRVRAQDRVRRADERPGERHRSVPWLHLLGPSAGPCRGLSGPRHLSRREPVRAGGRTLALLGRGRALAEGSLPNVVDIRNLGLAAGIDLAPSGPVGTRGFAAFTKAFDLGLMVRQSGDAIAMSPPLVIEKAQIDEIIDITAQTIRAIAQGLGEGG